jgi:alanine-glyoxylate transaminase/serine-glyoxylate transaminase/serine-pyruvate transaminase
MIYALQEALRLVDEEGLDARYARHRTNSHALMAGLDALGFEPTAQEGARLTTLHCVAPPPGIDEAWGRKTLLQEYGIEIGAGLGPLQGRAWRIGLMGESSTRANVEALLGALEQMFLAQGWIPCAGAALDAAARIENVASK